MTRRTHKRDVGAPGPSPLGTGETKRDVGAGEIKPDRTRAVERGYVHLDFFNAEAL
jgi:hypothetical protein